MKLSLKCTLDCVQYAGFPAENVLARVVKFVSFFDYVVKAAGVCCLGGRLN